MKLKYLKLFICFLCISSTHFAHTGIGTTTPDASAKLEVSASNKGFLPPRVTLTSPTDVITIAAPAVGLLVYNTGNNAGLVAGYYYWNGTSWATIATATGSGVVASIAKFTRTTAQTGITGGSVIICDVSEYANGNDISVNTSNGNITLAPGKTYRLRGSPGLFVGAAANSFVNAQWYNATTSTYVGGSSYVVSPSGNYWDGLYAGTTEYIITPTISTVLQFKVLNISNASTIGYDAPNTFGQYPWIEVQVISGNTAINGQSVDYGIARYTGVDGGALANGTQVSFDATAAGNLVWSGNKFTLKANKTYELESSLAIYQVGGGVGGRFQIYDYTNSVVLANGLFMSINGLLQIAPMRIHQ